MKEGKKFEKSNESSPGETFYGGEDACEGDSGGPLYRWHENEGQAGDEKAVIVGSVSRGHGCGVKNKAGVYVKIEAMLEWIGKQIKDESVDSC